MCSPRRVALILLATSCGACSSPRILVIDELPDELDFVGLVYRGPDDAWSGTGLAPVESWPLQVEVVEPEGPYDLVTLVGFSEGALRALTRASDDELRSASLDAPGVRAAPVSPPFSASGELVSDLVQLERDEPPISVSARWAGACPQISDEVGRAVEETCEARFAPCAVRARQEACELELASSECNILLRGTAPGLGRFELTDYVQPPQACNGIVEPSGDLVVDCAGAGKPECRYRLPAAPDPSPKFELHSVLLNPTWRNAFEGLPLVRDVVLRADRILVGYQAEPEYPSSCESRPSNMLHLSLPDLSLVHSATVANALHRFAPTAEENALVAVFGGRAPTVALITDDGQTLRARPLDEIEPIRISIEGAEVCREVFPLVVDEPTRSVAVLLGSGISEDEGYSDVLVLDLETLAPRFSPRRVPRKTRLLASAGPGRLWVFEGGSRLVELDLSSGVVASSQGLVPPGAPEPEPRFVLRWPTTEDLAISSFTPSLQGLFFVRTTGQLHKTRVFWEHDRTPFAMLPWPLDPTLLLVGVAQEEFVTVPAGPSDLAFYDGAAQRFLAPSTPLGIGRVEHLLPHEDGSVYGVSRAEGRVFRVRPVP